MKIRVGFISNSSSTSFVCDVSGEIVSGQDYGLEEAGMLECEEGHTFLEEYALCDEDKVYEIIRPEDSDDDLRGEFPSKHCPICQFKNLTDSDLIVFLLGETNQTREQVLASIRIMYKDYGDFAKSMGIERIKW